MEVKTKLAACVALSVLALVFKIVVFSSPGWVVVKSRVPDYDMIHNSDGRIDKRPNVAISFGVWYYKVCKCPGEEDNDDAPSGDDSDAEHHRKHHKKHRKHHKCYHRCYTKRHRDGYEGDMYQVGDRFEEDIVYQNDIPEDFVDAKDIISTSVEFARHGRHEISAYVTIGLILGVVGMVSAIVYARKSGVGKHIGRLACSTQVLSSFFYWLAIIRVATFVFQLRALQKHEIMDDHFGKDIRFSVPWCLIVGAIGAVLMDVAALFHLILISRDKKNGATEFMCHTDKVGSCNVPIIAPKGYEQLVVPYTEAGPLPEKKPIA